MDTGVTDSRAGTPEANDERVARAESGSPYVRRKERIWGPVTSLLLHGLTLLAAAWIVVSRPTGEGSGTGVGVDFAVGAGDMGQSGAGDEVAGIEALSGASLPETDLAGSVASLESSLASLIPDAATTLPGDQSEGEVGDGTGGGAGGSGEGLSFGEGSAGGSGFGEGAGSGAGGSGGGGGTSFFGISARGNRFLYIVDVSGSMGEGNRLEVLKDNLITSIESLGPKAAFFIIAYNERPQPMLPRLDWSRATDSNKDRARAWISRLGAKGGTVPATAFEMGFRFAPKPDVVYFMTDAQDTQELAPYVARLNADGRQARINCIAFGASGIIDVMKQIAEQSGGQYKFVSIGGDGEGVGG